MNLNYLTIFVRVAECNGFSKAARELGLAKSTVSERVKALEAELGVQLLARTTRRLSLTEAGEMLFDRGRDILSTATEAEQLLSDLRESPVGLLRVSVPVACGRRFLGPVIAKLLAEHPGLSMRVDLEDADVDLVRERYDLAVRIGDLAASGLIARRIGSSKRCVVGAPSYFALRGRPTSPDDLRDHEVLRYAYQREPDTWALDGPGGRVNVRVEGRLVCNHGDVLAETAAAGLGIAWLPDLIADPLIAEGRLEAVMDPYCQYRAPIHLVFPERRHRPLKVRLFADMLADALG